MATHGRGSIGFAAVPSLPSSDQFRTRSSGQRYEMRRQSDTVAMMASRQAAPAAEIRLLGSPEVLVRGRPLEVDTRKAVAILAVLATDGRPYGREELATLLWPDSDDAAARGALRRTLSVLRGAIGEDVLHVDRRQVALVGSRVAV